MVPTPFYNSINGGGGGGEGGGGGGGLKGNEEDFPRIIISNLLAFNFITPANVV